MAEPNGFQSRLQRLDILLQGHEQADPAAQARLQDVVALLLEMHHDGLERVLQHVTDHSVTGGTTLEALTQDPVVSGLLVLHGLHPVDLDTRVRGALVRVAPYLASHGGQVDLLSVSEEGVVHLKLEGSCQGCPSSRVTLSSMIEQEIYNSAPEVTAIEVEGLVDEPPASPQPKGFVPVGQLAVNGTAIHATVGV